MIYLAIRLGVELFIWQLPLPQQWHRPDPPQNRRWHPHGDGLKFRGRRPHGDGLKFRPRWWEWGPKSHARGGRQIAAASPFAATLAHQLQLQQQHFQNQKQQQQLQRWQLQSARQHHRHHPPMRHLQHRRMVLLQRTPSSPLGSVSVASNGSPTASSASKTPALPRF